MALANPEATVLRLIETTLSGGDTATPTGVALAIAVAVAASPVASAVAVSVAGGAIDAKPLPVAAGVAGLGPQAATTAMTSAHTLAAKGAEARLPRPSDFGIRRI
jgi:carbon monoxide dehydrogenase subunit G